MPEPFKNLFSIALIEQMADCFAQTSSSFNRKEFIEHACYQLEGLELKQRSVQIRDAMGQCLPTNFEQSAQILLSSLSPMLTPNKVSELPEHSHLLKGWAIMPMAEYVSAHGQAHFDLSMRLVYEMTQRFTAEFAIRLFLIEQQDATLQMLSSWLNDDSEHVRRLISEGTRPRLPWGLQLTEFVKDPSPILPLLEALKDDTSEYVRRSVANNLNDIAKDHPEQVIAISKRWLQSASPERVRLVKHACRTLFKQGKPEALALFGFLPALIKSAKISLGSQQIKMGNSLSVQLELVSSSKKPQQIMLDYVVYHKKASGKILPKVFKWKVFELAANSEIRVNKTHSFKPVTTRKYYAGEHRIAVLINGEEFAHGVFELLE